MNGNCHFVYGAALGTAAAVNLQTISVVLPNVKSTSEAVTLFILGGIIGGVLPDLDNPKSHIGQLSVPVSTVIGMIGGLVGKKGTNHRGILHDPFVYLIGLVLSYFYFTPLIGLFVGCLSHTYLDAFNPSGVPFLLGAKHLHLGSIASGSKESVLFTWINVALAIAIGILGKVLILI